MQIDKINDTMLMVIFSVFMVGVVVVFAVLTLPIYIVWAVFNNRHLKTFYKTLQDPYEDEM